jgi:hypothetical protein
MKIQSYQLTVTGDSSEDALFDLCADLNGRGTPWLLQRFANGELVAEETSAEYADRFEDEEPEALDMLVEQLIEEARS